METEFSNQMNNNSIDITFVLRRLWKAKIIVIVIAVIAAIGSYFFVVSLPNIYKADVLLRPANAKGGGAFEQLSSSFGGLANLAGVSLPSGGDDSVALGIQIMTSRVFLGQFIKDNELLVPLMAVERWDAKSDNLIFNEEVYDPEKDIWVRDVEYPFVAKPSINEAVESFRDIIRITEDKDSGLYRVSIEHFSPKLAAQWSLSIVKSLNDYMKLLDRQEAESGIRYLTEQIERTTIAFEKEILYTMMQEHKKTIMFTEVRKEYLFKIIDPPVIPLIPDSPKRLIIMIFLIFIVTFFALILIVSKAIFQERALSRITTHEELK